jgi:hypothetical protein
LDVPQPEDVPAVQTWHGTQFNAGAFNPLIDPREVDKMLDGQWCWPPKA